jgi:hypothetical protein
MQCGNCNREDYLNLFFSHWNYKQCCFSPILFATLSILFAPHHIAHKWSIIHSRFIPIAAAHKNTTDIPLAQAKYEQRDRKSERE